MFGYYAKGENASFFIVHTWNLEQLNVPTICFYEAFKPLLVERDEDSSLLAVGIMPPGNEVELDRSLTLEAAHISLEYKLTMAQTASTLPLPVHSKYPY